MKIIRFLIRLVPGLVFVFSGFVKAVDPLGSAYKFTDYFEAFHLDFLSPLSLPLAFVLSSLEMLIGLALLMNYGRKFVAWALLLFMSFFTLLTLVLALTDPVSDCGCFGDALILSNWATFIKNLILLPFAMFVFADRKRPEQHTFFLGQGFAMLTLFLLAVGLSWYSYRHLPVLDFRPYSVGSNIPEKSMIPPDAPVDQYETTLFYLNKQTGEVKEFTLENYPGDTAIWAFSDAQSRLLSKGYEPPIHDFEITDPDGINLSDEILGSSDPVLLMLAYDLSKSDVSVLKKAAAWSDLARFGSGLRFYAVTASPGLVIETITMENQLPYSFCSADEIMLKTVVRSNPGFVLIRDGIILGKWAGRDFPAIAEVNPDWPEAIEHLRDQFSVFGEELGEDAFLPGDLMQSELEPAPRVLSVLLTMNEKSENFMTAAIFVLAVLIVLLLSLLNRKSGPSGNFRLR